MDKDIHSAKVTQTLEDSGEVKNSQLPVTPLNSGELKDDEKKEETTTDETVTETETEATPTEPTLEEKYKQLESELAALKAAKESPKEPEKKDETKPRTWDDLSVDELRAYRQHFRDSGEHAKADQINDMISNRMVTERQSKEQETRTLNQRKLDAWNEASKEISESSKQLNDPDFDISNQKSAIYQLADQIFRNNPTLANLPEGEAWAAREAQRQLLSRKFTESKSKVTKVTKTLQKEQSKTALEGNGRPGNTEATVTELMEQASNYPVNSPMWTKLWRQANEIIARQQKTKAS